MKKKKLVVGEKDSIDRACKIKLGRRKMKKKEREELEAAEKLAKQFGGSIINDELIE